MTVWPAAVRDSPVRASPTCSWPPSNRTVARVMYRSFGGCRTWTRFTWSGRDRMIEHDPDPIAPHVVELAGAPRGERVAVERAGRSVLGRVGDRVAVVVGANTACPLQHRDGLRVVRLVREQIEAGIGFVLGQRMRSRALGVSRGLRQAAPTPTAIAVAVGDDERRARVSLSAARRDPSRTSPNRRRADRRRAARPRPRRPFPRRRPPSRSGARWAWSPPASSAAEPRTPRPAAEARGPDRPGAPARRGTGTPCSGWTSAARRSWRSEPGRRRREEVPGEERTEEAVALELDVVAQGDRRRPP